MKKVIASILIIAVCLASVSAAAFDWTSLNLEVYGGLGVQQAKVSDFKDIRVSDYRFYGLSEGSLLLPLAEANGNYFPVSLLLGVQSNYTKNLSFLADFTIGYLGANSYLGDFSIGAKYFFMDSPIRVGAGAKIGFFYVEKALGEARILQGTTPPVILREGTIRNGYDLSYTVQGVSISPFVEGVYAINRQISLNFDLGFNIGASVSSTFEAREGSTDIIIDVAETQDFYEPNSDYPPTRTSIDPKVSITGFFATVSVSYKL